MVINMGRGEFFGLAVGIAIIIVWAIIDLRSEKKKDKDKI